MKLPSRCRPLVVALLMLTPWAYGQTIDAQPGAGDVYFPIGIYELPADDAALKAMADAGINLIRCSNRADLDRAHAVGMRGVVPLNLQEGAGDSLRALVESVADHPALAVWEGPDEVVWNFTAFSGLHKTMGVHKVAGEWWQQTPEALAYAEQQAAVIIPKMGEAAEFVRSRDPHHRPLWINEAVKSDAAYVRQYLEYVDITGCDIYPVKAYERPIARVGGATDRWNMVGQGKPVWMVLQAFSWTELGESPVHKEPAYPTFAESRFMAYDAIAHGARGILYWGSAYTKHAAFRESIYAVTRELAALQRFLAVSDADNVHLGVVELEYEHPTPRVRLIARHIGADWLIVLVNEDDDPHMAVIVGGLAELNNRPLHRLYDPESLTVARGEIVVRLLPREVRVYATDRKYETSNSIGRDFADTPPAANP